MGEFLKELGSLFVSSVSSDVSPEDRKAARRVFVKVGWRVAICVALFWAFGLFESVGWGGGFARASDMDEKIAAATRPIAEQVAKQSQAVKNLTDIVNEQLANSVAAEIRRLTGNRCKEPSPSERERLIREIERKQDEYYAIKDRYYTSPGCADL